MPSYVFKYIAFEQNVQTEARLQLATGITPVLQPAVDARHWNNKKLQSLLLDRVLSLRCYEILHTRRYDHADLPSTGAIGCTLSHVECWKSCFSGQILMVAEQDCKPLPSFNFAHFEKFVTTLPPNFIVRYVSSQNNFGTHFYACDYEACQTLLKYAFPIEIQVDSYMMYLDKHHCLKEYKFYKQIVQAGGPSTIQNYHAHFDNSFNFLVIGIPCVALAFLILLLWVLHYRKYSICPKTPTKIK